ncbi:MAG TPA: SHOCT domain-containing protein [Candidatus Acidoferrales bacterium]|nr:SHOCT domain-containing protein [Candidatus Acidoferrales bacterium]
MKTLVIPVLAGMLAVVLLAGCETHLGGGSTTKIEQPTLGQQLIDLQRAKAAGAITDAEYQTQKTRLLDGK